MTEEQSLIAACGTHGNRIAAVVCKHMLAAKDRNVGFVENSDDPNDLQAWCLECERVFEVEGALTPAFLEFNGMSVVCDFCYVAFKSRFG